MSDTLHSSSLLIQKTETQWMNLLYHAVETTFEQVWIPSHDATHHLRVWNYAKELILKTEKESTNDFITNLLFACFFHDTGMSITTEREHGKHSRKLCEKFLSQNKIKFNLNLALEAIEYHDDKAYKSCNAKNNKVLKYLSVADDLDAFGAIGIYRYFEIYHLRGFKINEMPTLVIKNAQQRFANFKKQFNIFHDIIEKQELRYEYLISFYKELKQELAQNNSKKLQFTSPFSILEFIKKNIILNKSALKQTTMQMIEKYSFFSQLLNELDVFQNNTVFSLKR